MAYGNFGINPLGYYARTGMKPPGAQPLSALQALEGAGQISPLQAAGSFLTKNATPIGIGISALQAGADIYGGIKEREGLRKQRTELKKQISRGDPGARAALQQGTAQIGANNKYTLQQASGQLSRTGGQGMGLLQTRLAGDTNRAVSSLQSNAALANERYRSGLRSQVAGLSAAIEESKGRSITNAASRLGAIPGLLVAQQQRDAGAEQRRIENQFRERAFGLQEAAMQQSADQFQQRQDLTREQMQQQGIQATQDRNLRFQQGLNAADTQARQIGAAADQRKADQEFELQKQREEYDLKLRNDILDGTQGGQTTLGAFPKLADFDRWVGDHYGGSYEGALEQAYRSNDYEAVAIIYGNMAQHLGKDIPKANNLVITASRLLQSPDTPEELRAQAETDIKEAKSLVDDRITMWSPAARDAYALVYGRGPTHSALQQSMQAQGEAAQQNPFEFALYNTKFR